MKVIVLSKEAAPVLFSSADCVVVETVADFVRHRDAAAYIDLEFIPDERRLAGLSRMLPSTVLVNSVTTTIAEMGHPFVRINGWPGMLERAVHELVVPDRSVAVQVDRLYNGLGHAFKVAPDIPGMVTARVLSALINEAWYTWEAGVSSKEEIDTAMKLGTNYPLGPFEWGERIGLSRVVGLLEVLSRSERRYMPADSLRKAAAEIKI